MVETISTDSYGARMQMVRSTLFNAPMDDTMEEGFSQLLGTFDATFIYSIIQIISCVKTTPLITIFYHHATYTRLSIKCLQILP
jgi:hypothetical protein